uniref:CX domain-containing protein n=1 Tax=Parastrongyloides trichosuri TaxID=131310 RepID=A0A0N4Z2M9_PARTI
MIEIIIALFFTIFFTTIYGTPSVYSCPGNGNFLGFRNNYLPSFQGGLGGGVGVGEVCGTGSIFHYWSCCEENPFMCCMRFETWFVVSFWISIAIFLIIICFVAFRFLMK